MTQTTWSDGPTSGRAAPGTTIGGRYALRSAIGNGGMGTVWRASDTLLRRDVAVKEVVLPPGLAPSDRDAMYERTMREARAAAALSHPSVVQVYDVVTEGGRPWIVMELLDARSLADMVIEDGPLAPRAVAKIGIALLGALEVAHAAGVLHRDVKPANVLICSDGRCVLTDFGVARMPTDVQLTTPGMVLGSPHFISPERAMGGPFGPPSDLFSLGVTLYTAVEGHPPFDKGDPIETMHAVVEDPPAQPVRAGDLTTVLLGLLDKEPARRWTVDAARSNLRNLLAGPLASSSPQFTTDPYAVVPTQRLGQLPALPATQPPALAAPTTQSASAAQPTPTGQVGGRAMLAPGESLADRIAQGSQPAAAAPPTPAAASGISVPTAGYPTQPGSAGPPAVASPPIGAGSPPGTAVPAGPGLPSNQPGQGWPPQQQPFNGPQPLAGQVLPPGQTWYPGQGMPPGQVLPPGQVIPPGQVWQAGEQPGGRFIRSQQPGSGPLARFKALPSKAKMIAGGGLAAVVLIVSVVLLNLGEDPPGNDPSAVPTGQSSPSNAVALPTQLYEDDRGITVNVPQGWTKSAAGAWVDFLDPEGSRKVRILVERATDPVKFLQAAESGLKAAKSSCIKPYARVDLVEDVQLDGKPAAQLEYTCGEGDEARHGIWRAVLQDHKAYSFYLTSKDSQFQDSKAIFDEMVRSFKLNPT